MGILLFALAWLAIGVVTAVGLETASRVWRHATGHRPPPCQWCHDPDGMWLAGRRCGDHPRWTPAPWWTATYLRGWCAVLWPVIACVVGVTLAAHWCARRIGDRVVARIDRQRQERAELAEAEAIVEAELNRAQKRARR
jgi:hypothetical protein